MIRPNSTETTSLKAELKRYHLHIRSGISPSDPCFANVHIVPGLKQLSLADSYVDDPHCTNMNRFPNLEHLSLNFTDQYGCRMPLRHMSENTPHLKSLQIIFSQTGVPRLPILYNLKALRITPRLSDSMINNICRLTQLQVLDLVLTTIRSSYNDIRFTNWFIDLLSRLPNLKILKFARLPFPD